MTAPRDPSRSSLVSPEPDRRHLLERQCQAMEKLADSNKELVFAAKEQTKALQKLEETVRQALHKKASLVL